MSSFICRSFSLKNIYNMIGGITTGCIYGSSIGFTHDACFKDKPVPYGVAFGLLGAGVGGFVRNPIVMSFGLCSLKILNNLDN